MEFEYTVTEPFTLPVGTSGQFRSYLIGQKITDPAEIDAVMVENGRKVNRHAVTTVAEPEPKPPAEAAEPNPDPAATDAGPKVETAPALTGVASQIAPAKAPAAASAPAASSWSSVSANQAQASVSAPAAAVPTPAS